MNKTKSKTKALKATEKTGSGFFRALIFGFLVCALVWLVLSLVFAFVMSRLEDVTAAGNVFSAVVIVFSLLSGGFAAGKCDKTCALLSSFVLGTAVLGLCYALSTAFELSRNLGPLMKTVLIAVMLVCPMLGARISTREKKTRLRYKKRM